MADNMIFCAKCGRKMPASTRFCPGCGTPVSEYVRQAAMGGSNDPGHSEGNVGVSPGYSGGSVGVSPGYSGGNVGVSPVRSQGSTGSGSGYSGGNAGGSYQGGPQNSHKKMLAIIIIVVAAVVVAVVLLLLLVVLPNLKGSGDDVGEDYGVEEELETVDVFDGISMTYSGYDTEGVISLVYDSPDERLARLTASDFEVTPSTGISNGDVVTVTITDDAIDYLADSLGLVPETTTKNYIVQGMEEYDAGTDADGDVLAEDESPTEDGETPAEDEDGGSEEPEPVEVGSDSEYLCPYSSERLITTADLEDIRNGGYGALPADKSLEQMIINEIYAKHGYLFKTDEIQAYFEQKSWYQAIGYYTSDSDEVMSMMSEVEKDNIDFLKSFR